MKSVAPLPISRVRFGTEHSQAADAFRADYLVFLTAPKGETRTFRHSSLWGERCHSSGTCATSCVAPTPRKGGSMPGIRAARHDGVHANFRLGNFERHRIGDAFAGVLGADVD
jgi:hypothetical protein